MVHMTSFLYFFLFWKYKTSITDMFSDVWEMCGKLKVVTEHVPYPITLLLHLPSQYEIQF